MIWIVAITSKYRHFESELYDFLGRISFLELLKKGVRLHDCSNREGIGDRGEAAALRVLAYQAFAVRAIVAGGFVIGYMIALQIYLRRETHASRHTTNLRHLNPVISDYAIQIRFRL